MNRVFTALLVLPLLTSAACSRETPPATSSESGAEPAGETHAEEENAIHLNEDMVRDLRISTAPVAARTGAQQVSVLGEVVADHTRYAEVAPPAGGQIVRVLVDTNGTV